jgi:hypothetical protein
MAKKGEEHACLEMRGVLTVLITTILVSTGTYKVLKGDEDSSFEDSYYSFANTIDDAAEVHKINLFTTMRSFSNTISAPSMQRTVGFPFVTVPTFGPSCSRRQQSGAELIISPKEVEVGSLERACDGQRGWYEESKQLSVASGEAVWS